MRLNSLLWPLLTLAALMPGIAAAQEAQTASEPSKLWINPGFYSYHFDRHKGLEDKNPGLGVEWTIDSTYSLTAGIFRNSDRETSRYLGVYVMPFELYGVKLGAVVGGFDGYPNFHNGGWFPALIPTAAIEGRNWGLNIAFIPSYKDRLYGALTFQLKYRFSAD